MKTKLINLINKKHYQTFRPYKSAWQTRFLIILRLRNLLCIVLFAWSTEKHICVTKKKMPMRETAPSILAKISIYCWQTALIDVGYHFTLRYPLKLARCHWIYIIFFYHIILLKLNITSWVENGSGLWPNNEESHPIHIMLTCWNI